MNKLTGLILKNKYQLVVSVYFILSMIGICHHEIWLDEAQHFLLARDSHSFTELLTVCHNEGHPVLWNVLLFIITRFSTNVFYMQLLHVFISCLTVQIICKSNLSFAEKICIIFGLYILYEYNIISRNYGLSALMLFLFIYNYIEKKEHIVLLSSLLFLLANTHLFSLLLSFALVFVYIIFNKDILLKQNKTKILTAFLILLAGWMISVYSIIPPQNYGIRFINYDSSPYLSSQRILKTISVCLKGLFYIPDYTITGNYYENSLYVFSLHLNNWLFGIFSVIAFLIPAFILKNNRFAFTLFFSYTMMYLSVYFFLPLTWGIRYFGFFYLLFIACYWIARPKVSKAGIRISFLIFVIQFINGIFMYIIDLRYPFSESKNVALYLKEIQKGNEPVLILNRESRPAISVYTGKKYFGIETGDSLTYCLWQKDLPDSILKLKINKELEKNNSSIIVSRNLPLKLIDTSKLTLLKTFDRGMIRAENVMIYRYGP